MKENTKTELEGKIVNLDKINASLSNYPNLNSIFGKLEKIKTIYNFPYKQDKSEYEYNIYGILNSENFSDDLIKETANKPTRGGILELIVQRSSLNHVSFKKLILERLNFIIDKLKKIYTSEQFKNGLINNVFSFLSELEFAEFCLDSGYDILEVEPSLTSGKKLDLKIKINNKFALVEVITPRLKSSMLQKQVGFFSISAEIENNIKAEFEHHEIEKNNITEDFILVIDGNHARIDIINIHSAINNFRKNPESRYLSGVFLKKENNFIFIDLKNK